MHSVAQNDACASVMNDESPDRHGRGFRRVSNISVHDLLGDSLLQQGAGGDANAVGCRNLDGLAGARVASGAGGALDALSGEQAGQLQAFAIFETRSDLLYAIKHPSWVRGHSDYEHPRSL